MGDGGGSGGIMPYPVGKGASPSWEAEAGSSVAPMGAGGGVGGGCLPPCLFWGGISGNLVPSVQYREKGVVQW